MRTQCRKMKESFYINMYAAKNGVMNPRDGKQKDTCWNTRIPFSIKFDVMVSSAHTNIGTTR